MYCAERGQLSSTGKESTLLAMQGLLGVLHLCPVLGSGTGLGPVDEGIKVPGDIAVASSETLQVGYFSRIILTVDIP